MADSSSPQSSGAQTKSPKIPFWLWPHVLSLEAPLVAVAWALAMGRLHQVPWWPGVLPGLALCVWTIYLADRTLDGWATPVEALDERHLFYRRHKTWLLGGLIPICIAALVWLALWVIPSGLMWQSVALGLLVTLYLGIYTTGERRGLHMGLLYTGTFGVLVLINAMPLGSIFKLVVSVLILGLISLVVSRHFNERLTVTIPKEAAGGLLFALGSTAWVRFVGTGGALLGGALELMLLTALFTSNLTGITDREVEVENPQKPRTHGHPMLLGFIGLACAGVLYGAAQDLVPARIVPLAWAVVAGEALLALLHFSRRRFSANAYRVLADLAVLAPAVVILIVKA